MTETISNTAPLINSNGKYLSRRFLGKTSEFKDKQERIFNNKMLKGYTKGQTHFISGSSVDINGKRSPSYHEVKQEYFYI